MQDKAYDPVAKYFENNMTDLNEDLYTLLTQYEFTNNSKSIESSIQKLQTQFLHKEFKLTDINRADELIQKCEEKLLEFLDSFNTELINRNIHAAKLSELLYFRGYSKETKPFRYLDDLSNGEWNSLKYRYEISHILSQPNGFLWYIDEPEKSLHPEWCRTFFYDYMNAYKDVKQYLNSLQENDEAYTEKKYTLIFATHSPFLLSDLTNDYIIYLEKENGKTKQIESEKEVFAGNIGEMYNTNFFMQNTIGEFARSKLMEIITRINNNEDVTDETLKKWKLLISKIGDDLLRNLLIDKVESYEKNRTK